MKRVDETGMLVFEMLEDKPHVVDSRTLGFILTDNGVPKFMINLCKSEEAEEGPLTSVVSQLTGKVAKCGGLNGQFSVCKGSMGVHEEVLYRAFE